MKARVNVKWVQSPQFEIAVRWTTAQRNAYFQSFRCLFLFRMQYRAAPQQPSKRI
jgi:hypothetical protein